MYFPMEKREEKTKCIYFPMKRDEIYFRKNFEEAKNGQSPNEDEYVKELESPLNHFEKKLKLLST